MLGGPGRPAPPAEASKPRGNLTTALGWDEWRGPHTGLAGALWRPRGHMALQALQEQQPTARVDQWLETPNAGVDGQSSRSRARNKCTSSHLESVPENTSQKRWRPTRRGSKRSGEDDGEDQGPERKS